MIKLHDQLVAVDIPDPRDLTFKGNNSLCCQGTQPNPKAYDETNIIKLTNKPDDDNCDDISWKQSEHANSPTIINGILYNKIRLLPILSMTEKATSVNRKLVPATDIDVATGEVNPTEEKIVAEKYINTFCNHHHY